MLAPRFIGMSTAMMLLWCCTCSPDGSPSRSAPRGSLTTDTDSQSLPDKHQRLAFLARYLRLKSPVADAEFIIRYNDNSGGAIPGPSDWDIRVVLEVEGRASAWHEGWVPCPSDTKATWAEPLLGRRAHWQALRSAPRCYRAPRGSATCFIYEQDNIVIYRNMSERS